MNIPYRTRQILKRCLIALAVILLIGAVVGLCWFVWLQRYVVYTRNGVVINTDLSEIRDGTLVTRPQMGEVELIYKEEDDNAGKKDLTQMIGYYADAEALKDIPEVRKQAKLLQAGTALMLDVKDAKGRFFYSSAINDQRSSSIDTGSMDALIQELDQQGVYLIARLPALRDYYFGLHSTENGLFVASGQYLWADDDYCYWLDPTKQGTMMYLVQIVTELKSLGFDEVIFDEFRFPDTEDLKFSGDRTEALNATAKTLLASCGADNFAVSFVGSAEGFQLPAGRSRLYVLNAVAADAAGIALNSGVADPAVNLVFLTEFHDTRFNDYSVLRPLESAQ